MSATLIKHKKRLFEAGIRMLAENGGKEISVREMAESAGIGVLSAYSIYKSKNDFFVDCCKYWEKCAADPLNADNELMSAVGRVVLSRAKTEENARRVCADVFSSMKYLKGLFGRGKSLAGGRPEAHGAGKFELFSTQVVALYVMCAKICETRPSRSPAAEILQPIAR